MKKKSVFGFYNVADVVFLPAVAPMEASVLPAKEPVHPGAVNMVRRAFDSMIWPQELQTQRAKICVR